MINFIRVFGHFAGSIIYNGTTQKYFRYIHVKKGQNLFEFVKLFHRCPIMLNLPIAYYACAKSTGSAIYNLIWYRHKYKQKDIR